MCELLEFMYQGVVNVKHTELQSFMKIGQLLQIKGLATNSSSSAASTSSEKSSNKNENNVMNDETSFTSKPLLPSAIETASTGENSNIGGEKPSESNSHPNTPHRSQSPVLSPAASPLNNNSLNSATTNQANKSTESNVSLQQPSSHGSSSASGLKRHSEYSTDSLSIYSRNKHRRSITSTDHSSENNEGPDGASVSGGMEQMNTEDFFLPHISMVESRYELNNIKRENSDHHQNPGVSSAAAVAAASASLRNSFNSAAFGLDYTFYKNNNVSSQSGQEYPNDLHMSNEYSKSFANHMDIPPNCPNVVMLSSTSLLHGNCVFNRNNTVATQQGMKTYWLCKAYRISMCRARCITHQGKIISATGVHNHPPHMRGNGNNTGSNGGGGSSANIGVSNTNNSAPSSSPQSGNSSGVGLPPNTSSSGAHGLRYSQNSGPNANISQPTYHEHHHSATSPSQAPPLPPTFVANPHMHSGNTSNSNVGPPPHLFLQSMPNLLVQHYPTSQATQIAQPTFPPQHHNVLHNYEMPSAMQSSPSNEHHRNSNSSFDPNKKSLDALSKDNLNDEQIHIHNAGSLSPNGMHNSSVKGGHVESLAHNNEIVKKISSLEHHQVQVIDSITISPGIGPGEHWFQGKLEFMLSQRGKPLLVHDGHTFGIQYVRKDKKYWQCNLSRKFNCKARVTTTDTGEIIVTNNEHCHTEIRQHLRKDYQRNKVMMNALINLSTNRLAVENFRRHNSIANNLSNLQSIVAAAASTPLALQSNIKGTNSTAANLLDLGKQPTINIDTENHFKHTQTHHYEHHIPDSMNKIEDDDSHDEPLDCGIRTSSYQSERDSVNVLNENSNNPNTPQPTIYHENKNEWQCKNEDI
ncbi:hypothetical protein CVS40_6178 [Lucilia cuprina]|nr:hypothetical protein CVS40_6178 [Lucilia cuprina]